MGSILIFALIILAIDLYVFFGLRYAFFSDSGTTLFTAIFWGVEFLLLIGMLWSVNQGSAAMAKGLPRIIVTTTFILLAGKILFSTFLVIDDMTRAIRWLTSLFESTPSESSDKGISRLGFLVNGGVLVGTGMVAGLTYGIARGAHNYHVKKERITLPKLPSDFKGLKIVHISDIHSGSFWDRNAVKRGVKMITDQEPDVVFFTGDIVNNISKELDGYKEVFGKISAPLGVYSILGNHDYAEYDPTLSEEERLQSIREVIQSHKDMGWDILLNENRVLEKDGVSFGIVGVENWSAHPRFPKYGDMHKAYQGLSDTPVKLLLSHDPSHWRAQVIPEFGDIDITFSGHTHGMQFGIETAGFKWSPVKYMYPEWAGLYREAHQYLYVNRGFGYLGYPGRLGIRPEITVIELHPEA